METIISNKIPSPDSSILGVANLVPNASKPSNHLRDRLLVHIASRLPELLKNCKVGLQRVESRDRILEALVSNNIRPLSSQRHEPRNCETWCANKRVDAAEKSFAE